MRTSILLLVAALVPGVAFADLHDAMTPPDQVESAAQIEAEWTDDDGWVSPLRAGDGTRVGILLTADPAADLVVQARSAGPWLDAVETWSGGDDQRVLVVDFAAPVTSAQVRIESTVGLVDFAWKLFEPAGEARRLPGASVERSPVLTQTLRDIGVTAREDWGAMATECTATEDTWYRFAIHHTAGSQTSGGTVQGALQATQAWTMGGGGFCDIPYQFLVGYDGSLWEGRALNLRSGATGGGNNDGNIAISLLGCYDQPGCSGGGHTAELILIAATRLLVQTLSGDHFITPTTDNLRGHRQWPNNSTACPGDRILPRLAEIRSFDAHFQGELVGTSWGSEVATLEVGETVDGWVEIANTGLEVWGAGTRLAPLPRDEASPHATAAWISEGRISEPTADTPPGGTARFPLQLTGAAEGTTELSLALVEEWVTWFDLAPIGGGPAPGEMVLTVEVVPGEDPGDDDDAADDDDAVADDDDAAGDGPFFADAERQNFAPEGVGCACSSGDARSAGWLLLLPLALRRRR